MAFYKYLHAEHLEAFNKIGSVKIGTLNYYRKSENALVNDGYEGKISYSMKTLDDSISLSKDQVNTLSHIYKFNVGIQLAPYSNFSHTNEIPDAFIFSTSMMYNDDLMRQIGYNSFYEIINPGQFCECILAELNKICPICAVVRDTVQYVPSKHIYITNTNKKAVIRNRINGNQNTNPVYIEDYFTKTIGFIHEFEYRFIFIPQPGCSSSIFPIIIKNSVLPSCCSFSVPSTSTVIREQIFYELMKNTRSTRPSIFYTN